MNANTTLQIGCLSDTDYQYRSHSVKNYLQLTLIYDFTSLVRKHVWLFPGFLVINRKIFFLN